MQRRRERLPHAVVARRARILADDGGDGGGKREEQGEADRHEADDDSEGRDGIVAKGRHLSRRIGGGERAGEVGEYRRHGNGDNRRDVEREQARAQRGAQAVAVDNNVPGSNDEDNLRSERGKGGALQSPAAGEDEDGVKDGLRHGRAQADQHRQARTAKGKEG